MPLSSGRSFPLILDTTEEITEEVIKQIKAGMLSICEVVDNVPFHLQILNNAALFGDSPALSDDFGSITFTDVRKASQKMASVLKVREIHRGDSILVALHNRKEYPLIFLGCALLKATVSGCSHLSSTEELEHFLNESKARLIICEDDAEFITALEQNVNVEIVTLSSLMDDMQDAPEYEIPTNEEYLLDDVLIEPFSSGTAGLPKCVPLTHRNYIAATKSLSEALFSQLSMQGRRTTLAFLPFYHGSGFWALVYCLLVGHHSVIFHDFHPILMLKAIEEHKIDVINVVPSIVSLLCRIPVDGFDLSTLKTVLCGSAPLGQELITEFMAKFPSVQNLVQGYGMTETVVLTHITPLGVKDVQWGSCGRLLPGFEAKIVNDDDVEVTEPNEWGELMVRGEAVFHEYKGRRAATDADGWLATGDIVYKDEDEFFFVVDRKKDLIKVNGMQVAPAQLEDILLSHESVAEAVVVRMLHEKLGEVPRAFVVATEGREVDVNELQDFVKDRVAPFKQLRGGIVVLDELPRSKAGKVLRRELAKY